MQSRIGDVDFFPASVMVYVDSDRKVRQGYYFMTSRVPSVGEEVVFPAGLCVDCAALPVGTGPGLVSMR